MKFSVVTIAVLAGLAVAAPQKQAKNGASNAAAKANASGENTNNRAGNNAEGNARAGNNNVNANTNANEQQNNRAGNNTANNNEQQQNNRNQQNNNNQQQNNNNRNQQNNNLENNPNNPQIQDGSNDVNQAAKVGQQDALLMQTAIDAWMRDTGVVSNFLNIGGQITDETTFKNQALIAHSAEVDELTHKNVLDQFMPDNQNVKAANDTLSNGAFQLVVDQLRDMSLQGTQAAGGIDLINKDRCVNVLPNIDAYMREGALTIGNGQSIQQAVRPQACANIQPGQDGALNINEIPAGYVNGKLQDAPPGTQSNGNSNTLPNIPPDAAGSQPDTQI